MHLKALHSDVRLKIFDLQIVTYHRMETKWLLTMQLFTLDLRNRFLCQQASLLRRPAHNLWQYGDGYFPLLCNGQTTALALNPRQQPDSQLPNESATSALTLLDQKRV